MPPLADDFTGGDSIPPPVSQGPLNAANGPIALRGRDWRHVFPAGLAAELAAEARSGRGLAALNSPGNHARAGVTMPAPLPAGVSRGLAAW